MVPGNQNKEWTLLDLLNWTTEYFEEKGVDEARLNAEILLSEVMGMERVMLYARFENTVPPEKRRKFRRLVSARADRQPLQYLLGSSEFYGREFEVNDSVLVPRPETELLVDKCLEKIPEEANWRVADIGTGSGVIGLTLACECENVVVLATDSSDEALEMARSNATSLGVDDRVQFYQGNLCDPLANVGEKLDIITSNPPYIPTEDIDDLQPEVKDWEPRCALDGGEDGLDAIREIIPASLRLLEPGGWLMLEMGEGQADEVRALAEDEEGVDGDDIETVEDDNCERIMAIRKKTS